MLICEPIGRAVGDDSHDNRLLRDNRYRQEHAGNQKNDF